MFIEAKQMTDRERARTAWNKNQKDNRNKAKDREGKRKNNMK